MPPPEEKDRFTRTPTRTRSQAATGVRRCRRRRRDAGPPAAGGSRQGRREEEERKWAAAALAQVQRAGPPSRELRRTDQARAGLLNRAGLQAISRAGPPP